MNIGDTIAPKSEQMDSVDLLRGAQTFRIERVTEGKEDQPFNLHLADFPRPWRPGLSMRRVLVFCWGGDASAYVGRRVRLFCDPKVMFGGQAVGGIRLEALSHIDKPMSVPLLVTRGKSQMFTVQPLTDEPAPPTTAPKQTPELTKLAALFKQAGIAQPQRLALVAEVVGRTVNAPNELTDDEVAAVVAELQLRAEGPE